MKQKLWTALLTFKSFSEKDKVCRICLPYTRTRTFSSHGKILTRGLKNIKKKVCLIWKKNGELFTWESVYVVFPLVTRLSFALWSSPSSSCWIPSNYKVTPLHLLLAVGRYLSWHVTCFELDDVFMQPLTHIVLVEYKIAYLFLGAR